jgi:hypothetical protein
MVLVFVGAISVPLLFGYIVVYIARCYTLVLTQSSGGVDRVRWPKETFHDWLGDAWLVLLILVAFVSLTAILTAPLALAVTERWQAFAVGGLAGLFVWFAFPIALCSAHHPALLAALPLRFGAMVRVWGMTTPLAGAAGFGVALTLLGYMAGPYLVTIMGPLAILIHARAWGRFVWLALNDRPRRRRKSSKSDFRPEPETAFRSAESAAAARAVIDEGDYVLEASDWAPEEGHLAEQHEIDRERVRWNRLRAGEETVDPLGRSKAPKAWTALAPSKIFGILLDGETAAATVCIGGGLALLSGFVLALRLAIGP